MIEIIAMLIGATVTSSCGYMLGYAAAKRMCVRLVRQLPGRARLGISSPWLAAEVIATLEGRPVEDVMHELHEEDAP